MMCHLTHLFYLVQPEAQFIDHVWLSDARLVLSMSDKRLLLIEGTQVTGLGAGLGRGEQAGQGKAGLDTGLGKAGPGSAKQERRQEWANRAGQGGLCTPLCECMHLMAPKQRNGVDCAGAGEHHAACLHHCHAGLAKRGPDCLLAQGMRVRHQSHSVSVSVFANCKRVIINEAMLGN